MRSGTSSSKGRCLRSLAAATSGACQELRQLPRGCQAVAVASKTSRRAEAGLTAWRLCVVEVANTSKTKSSQTSDSAYRNHRDGNVHNLEHRIDGLDNLALVGVSRGDQELAELLLYLAGFRPGVQRHRRCLFVSSFALRQCAAYDSRRCNQAKESTISGEHLFVVDITFASRVHDSPSPASRLRAPRFGTHPHVRKLNAGIPSEIEMQKMPASVDSTPVSRDTIVAA